MLSLRFRSLLAVCVVATALALVVSDAQARAGRGGSFGSRGSQTFSAPPWTATPPSARPIERSMTQPGQPGTVSQRPSTSPVGGFFNRPGFLGGLFAGFLGAGLLGMLFGHGLMGGLGGFSSILGLLLQIGLVVIVARLAWVWWQRRNQPALAGGPTLRNVNAYARDNAYSAYGSAGGSAPAQASSPALKPADFDTFERLLTDVTV